MPTGGSGSPFFAGMGCGGGEGEGPQGRPPQAAVGRGPPRGAAPQARAEPGLPCGPHPHPAHTKKVPQAAALRGVMRFWGRARTAAGPPG